MKNGVRSGHIGYGLFSRQGSHIADLERVCNRLEAAGFVVEEAEIVVHEADQPDAVGDLLHSDALASEDLADIDLELSDADAAAGGDRHGAVVEWIVEFGQSAKAAL